MRKEVFDMAYKDPAVQKAYAKHYYEANREKRKAYQNRYREANPEKVAATNNSYHEANREKLAADSKRYHKANREKGAAVNKRWRKANPDNIKTRNAARRAAKAGVGHVAYVDAEVFDRDDWYCQACGVKTNRDTPYEVNPVYATVDHIIPIDKQGHDALYNLQTLCFSCNASKGTKDNDEFMKEFA